MKPHNETASVFGTLWSAVKTSPVCTELMVAEGLSYPCGHLMEWPLLPFTHTKVTQMSKEDLDSPRPQGSQGQMPGSSGFCLAISASLSLALQGGAGGGRVITEQKRAALLHPHSLSMLPLCLLCQRDGTDEGGGRAGEAKVKPLLSCGGRHLEAS